MSQSKILCFHPPDLLKWIPHPYNWVFYRQITHLSPDDAVYLVPRGYQQDNSNLQGLFTPQFMLDHEMRVPNGFDIGNCTVETYDHGYQFNPFAASLNQVAANQIAGQADPVLDQAIRPGFEKLVNDHDISAIWTWVNTVAIEKLAAEHGLPVIHCEWAAFRPPNYRSLAFFDFSGVNGNTDARRMAHEFRDTGGFGALPNHDLADLHRLFMPDATKAPGPAISDRYGIALQVEVDTNSIAFAKGWDNSSLISYGPRVHGPNGLIRQHPSQLMGMRQSPLPVDDSPDVLGFLGLVNKLITVNSSVAFEAAFFGRDVEILGDSPYLMLQDQAFLQSLHADKHEARRLLLNWYLWIYLVPYSLTIDMDYIRFRLGNPAQTDICRYHRDYYRKQGMAI